MKAGEIICPYQKDQTVKFAMGYIKEKKKRSVSIPKVGGQLLQSEATPIRIRETPPLRKKKTQPLQLGHIYI